MAGCLCHLGMMRRRHDGQRRKRTARQVERGQVVHVAHRWRQSIDAVVLQVKRGEAWDVPQILRQARQPVVRQPELSERREIGHRVR